MVKDKYDLKSVKDKILKRLQKSYKMNIVSNNILDLIKLVSRFLVHLN